MGRRRDARVKIEHGDFQTPPALAAEVCSVLAASGCAPRAIVEPTCGTGGLLAAALDAFPGHTHALGIDINAEYIDAARAALGDRPGLALRAASFFATDWAAELAALPAPLLIIGNPPWVTNSDLGALGSANLPDKANFHGRTGLDAVTGKSNFDISEWMLVRLLDWLAGRDATLAMLCKASVARKVLAHAWRDGRAIRASTYRIDAAARFGASVEACLLVCELGDSAARPECARFDRLATPRVAKRSIGFRDGALIADVDAYDRWTGLVGDSPYAWRSGIKHDCAAIMELRRTDAGLENGLGERVEIEDRWLYPLCKSSDVARAGELAPRRYMLVPQHRVGDDTELLRDSPRTWDYLTRHRARLDRRASAIYRGKPPFAIFGVGDYTFAPWKVAISGLYKKLAFRVIGPHDGKPVVLDDTCYFLACRNESEARGIAALLASEPATELFQSLVFWDAKRPITTELLRRLDLQRLAQLLDAPWPPAAPEPSQDPSQEPEQEQRDGERGQEHERADADEARDADLDAGAAQQIDPQEAGERADRQEPRADVAADQRGEQELGLAIDRVHVEDRHRMVVDER